MFGVLAVDKPAGWTSRDVVNRVQGLVRPTKVGHTGTLDPMATGVLLLVVGPATRLMEFSHRMPKRYDAEFLLGCSSDTLDTDGLVQACSSAVQIGRQQWTEAMGQWLGKIQQRPPRYSAVHLGGRRAHELARAGVDFEVQPREVTIFDLELVSFEYPVVRMRIECSTGTYVRCLGSDIAKSLGSDAVMSRLVRTQIGPFLLADSTPLAELGDRQSVAALLDSPLKLLPDLPVLDLSDEQCRQLRNGQPIVSDRLPGQNTHGQNTHGQNVHRRNPPNKSVLADPPSSSHASSHANTEQLMAAVDSEGRLVAILTQVAGQLRSRRVFH
jgi:tRNA pseudouridine55 synthase